MFGKDTKLLMMETAYYSAQYLFYDRNGRTSKAIYILVLKRCSEGINKNLNFIILGTTVYCRSRKGFIIL